MYNIDFEYFVGTLYFWSKSFSKHLEDMKNLT